MTSALPEHLAEYSASLDVERIRLLRIEADRVASKVRLPRLWSFHTGNSGKPGGATSGSSLEFRDHRPYVPGDDFRHIDWISSARSPGFLMKVFEEDRAPALDLVVDCSRSMWYDNGKFSQTVALLFLFEQLCRRETVTLKIFPLGSPPPALRSALQWERGPLLQEGSALSLQDLAPQDLATLPLRHRTVRVLISDLLFPLAPEDFLRPLVRNAGAVIMLAPYGREERSPAVEGRVELIDCEDGSRRQGWVDSSVIESYMRHYQEHFAQWRNAAASHQILFIQVGPDDPLSETATALAQRGALELKG